MMTEQFVSFDKPRRYYLVSGGTGLIKPIWVYGIGDNGTYRACLMDTPNSACTRLYLIGDHALCERFEEARVTAINTLRNKITGYRSLIAAAEAAIDKLTPVGANDGHPC